MLKVIKFFFIISFFFSCNSSSKDLKIEFLEKEIQELKLNSENFERESIAPIVIDMNYGSINSRNVSKFAIGFVYDRPLLLDSITYSLYKVNTNENDLDLIETKREGHKFNSDDPQYFVMANYNNLNVGNYLIKGYIICKGRKMDLKRYFEVL